MSNSNFNLQKLNPFLSNLKKWFKLEERPAGTAVPVRREEYNHQLAAQDPFVQLHNEIDRLFDNVGFPSLFHSHRGDGLSRLWPSFNQGSSFNPSLNVSAEKNAYVVTLEAAGLDEKDINLEVEGQQLIITGNKREESENKDRHYYRIERHYGTFQRVLSLPDDAVASDITALFSQGRGRKGLLTVTIPRLESVSTDRQKIPIQQV